MKGTSSCCQARQVHPLGCRPCAAHRHLHASRRSVHQRRRVSGHQLCGRAPRRQRAGRRRTVGAGSNRRAHVSGASKYSRRRAAPPAGWRPTGSSSSPDAGHGTRASRKPLQPSSSTAPPASHGRRLPTSSAPPGTAPAPVAAGRARAPTRCTGRANASTAPLRKTAPGPPWYEARRESPGSQGRRMRQGRDSV